MSSGGDDVWAAVKRAYECSEIPVGQICATYGVTKGQLTYRRRRDGWKGRCNGAAPTVVQRVTARPASDIRQAERLQKSSVLAVAPDAEQYAHAVSQLMDRLFRVTEKELTIIEDRMANDEIRSPADSARDTSSIGSLIRNLEKLTEFNEQVRGAGEKRGSIGGITADEADAIRRDLALRIERLTKS